LKVNVSPKRKSLWIREVLGSEPVPDANCGDSIFKIKAFQIKTGEFDRVAVNH